MFPNFKEIDTRINLELTTALVEYTQQFIRQAPANIQILLRNPAALSVNVITNIWVIFAVIFLVFYPVIDIEKARLNLTLQFPKIDKDNIAHLPRIIDQKVGAYIRGTLMKCLFAGLLTRPGLTLMGMPFALMLGIMAGPFNVIQLSSPY